MTYLTQSVQTAAVIFGVLLIGFFLGRHTHADERAMLAGAILGMIFYIVPWMFERWRKSSSP